VGVFSEHSEHTRPSAVIIIINAVRCKKERQSPFKRFIR